MLDLSAIAASPVATEPFCYFSAERVLDGAALAAIGRDYPDIRAPGIYPLEELACGAAFRALIDDIRSADELA